MTVHSASDEANPTFRLPAELVGEYEEIGPLGSGGESVLLLAKHLPSGDQVVVKLYLPGRPTPAGRILECLKNNRESNHDHVVWIRDFNPGRYEILEYLAPGTLRDFFTEQVPPYPLSLVRQILEQIVDAIDSIRKTCNLMFFDLNAENLLVRGKDPLDLVLTDFGGIGLIDDRSVIFGDIPVTLAQLPPESRTGGIISPTLWCYELGLILYEAILGSHPFKGVSEKGLKAMATTEQFDLSEVKDERWRNLLTGLLTRDYEHRWNLSEIQRWLKGGDPPLPRDIAPGRFGYDFAGHSYTDSKALAEAFADNWEEAVTRVHGERSRRGLEDWLLQSGDLNAAALLDALDREQRAPSFRLAAIIAHLDPSAEPTVDGYSVAARNLPDLAGDPNSRAVAVVKELFDEQVLAAYEPVEPGLRAINALWQEAAEVFHREAPSAEQAGYTPLTDQHTPLVRGRLLALAASPKRTRSVWTTLHSGGATLAPRDDWFRVAFERLQSEAFDLGWASRHGKVTPGVLFHKTLGALRSALSRRRDTGQNKISPTFLALLVLLEMYQGEVSRRLREVDREAAAGRAERATGAFSYAARQFWTYSKRFLWWLIPAVAIAGNTTFAYSGDYRRSAIVVGLFTVAALLTMAVVDYFSHLVREPPWTAPGLWLYVTALVAGLAALVTTGGLDSSWSPPPWAWALPPAALAAAHIVVRVPQQRVRPVNGRIRHIIATVLGVPAGVGLLVANMPVPGSYRLRVVETLYLDRWPSVQAIGLPAWLDAAAFLWATGVAVALLFAPLGRVPRPSKRATIARFTGMAIVVSGVAVLQPWKNPLDLYHLVLMVGWLGTGVQFMVGGKHPKLFWAPVGLFGLVGGLIAMARSGLTFGELITGQGVILLTLLVASARLATIGLEEIAP